MKLARACGIATTLILSVTPTLLHAQAPPPVEVEKISFVGNEAYQSAELRQAIVTEQTTCKTIFFKFPIPLCPFTNWGIAFNRHYLDEKELPLDVLRLRVFYRQRGYRQVAVDTALERQGDKVKIEFEITENEPTRIRQLTVEGLEGRPDSAQLRDDFSLRVGDAFNIVALERGKQRIENRLLSVGYLKAAVLDEYFIPEGSREADLVVTVIPGERARIASIDIEGATDLDPNVIRQFLTFHEGEYYSEARIQESQRNLFDLEALRFASIESNLETGTDSLVDITVQATEAPIRAFRAGVGLSTTECGVVQGSATHRNFFGDARRFEVSARLGNIGSEELNGTFPCSGTGDTEVFRQLTYRVRADFSQPYFLSLRNNLLAAVFFERESVPNIFVSTSLGAQVGVSRRENPRLQASFSYRPELTSFDRESTDVFFCVSFGVCDPADITTLTEARWLSPLVATWLYDRTDSRFNPTSGYRVTPQAELAADFTGSQWDYIRFAVDAANFYRISSRWTLGLHLRGGFVEPTSTIAFEDDDDEVTEEYIVNPAKRFFAGGANSVRGFGQNLLGPTVLVIDSVTQCPTTPLQQCAFALADTAANEFVERPTGGNAAIEGSVEVRYLLNAQWGLAAFVDWGQVFPDLTAVDPPAVTPGMGLRFQSPVGPIRLDIGYNTTGSRLRSVVAELEDGSLRELPLPVDYNPFSFGDASLFTQFVRRLRLHLAIGQAF